MMPTIYPVACHTRNVGPGCTFVAIKGMNTDGILFIPQALKNGATTIVVQVGTELSQDVLQLIAQHKATVTYVPNTREHLAELSAQAAGFPAQKLKIVGITGTKGKTTTCFLLAHILRSAGHKVALLSTVHNQINDTILPASLTTAHPDYLHQFFKVCVNEGVEYVIMETAAQAYSLSRTAGINFDGIVFTNFSLEHLEFYATLEDYFAAKCGILTQAKLQSPIIINADDEWLQTQLPRIPQHEVITFGLSKSAQLIARNVQCTVNGIQFVLDSPIGIQEYRCPNLMGTFNVYNILGAITMAVQCRISLKQTADAIVSFTGVKGRLEKYILSNGATCFIDHAHNPSSFEQVLGVLRGLTPHLIVLFGAGGKRDASKRPLMSEIASRFADHIILTNDNPRTEDPDAIMQDLLKGIPTDRTHKIIVEFDRELAIKKACALSKQGSIIALLGKGSDEYQIFGEVKTPFYERLIVQEL